MHVKLDIFIVVGISNWFIDEWHFVNIYVFLRIAAIKIYQIGGEIL